MQRNGEKETAVEREGHKENGGLELDEGHISSHSVTTSEKSPWLLK